MNIDDLNAEFGLSGQLEFIEGRGGIVLARIHNGLGEAVVSTYSGQALSFRPAGETHDLLFVSDAAYYEHGKAIKGGVPVCWPWFGPDPDARGRPAHGFVRNRQWDVLLTEALDDGRTRLLLGLDADDATRELWPNEFGLRIEFCVGSMLEITLTTTNRSPGVVTLTQALHTYFRVGDIAEVRVLGLDGCSYIDKVDAGREKVQEGAVAIAGEVDRIYADVDKDLVIDDARLHRRIRIQAIGSRSAVVWNPWSEKGAAMADFGDDEFRTMLCVETANAGADVISIAAGEDYRLGVRYSVDRD